MYKVLFAEDEMLVRLGLKNSIDWAKYNMEVVADEENGEEAYAKFLELRPDVVITDIRMPGIDGHELIRRIRQEDTSCAIIVVSCLNDFDLLREMMQYRLLGYVLKAGMEMNEITELLQKAENYLDEHRVRMPREENLIPSLDSLMLQYVLEENISCDAFLTKCEQYNYTLIQPLQSILMVHLTTDQGEGLSELALSFITELIQNNLPNTVSFSWDENTLIALSGEHVAYGDEGVGRITQMLQSFFEGASKLVLQKALGGYDTLPQELRELEVHCNSDTDAADYAVRKAMDYVSNHYGESLTLSAIASHVRLSPNYFSTLFKKETGMTYVQYLNDVRIEKAKLLLKNTDHYLYEVSEMVGFNTFDHFSQTFKKKTGVNPGDYRRYRKDKKSQTEER